MNTSLWMNFTSNRCLQVNFHQFDLEMPPKGVKSCICESQNSQIFVKWFDGKKNRRERFFYYFSTLCRSKEVTKEIDFT